MNSKTSVSASCSQVFRQSYITFQHCLPGTAVVPRSPRRPPLTPGPRSSGEEETWMFFVCTDPERAGAGAAGALRPLAAVEELGQFADVLDGVLEGLYFGEGLAALAVDGGQVIAQRVQRVRQGPHAELLPLAGLPAALRRHPRLGQPGRAGPAGGGQLRQPQPRQPAAVGRLGRRRAGGRGVGFEGGRRG